MVIFSTTLRSSLPQIAGFGSAQRDCSLLGAQHLTVGIDASPVDGRYARVAVGRRLNIGQDASSGLRAC